MRRLVVPLAVSALLLVGCAADDGVPTDLPSADPSATRIDSPSPEPEAEEASSAPGETAPGTASPTTEPTEGEGAPDTVTLTSTLTGDTEVPGPGDPGGSGSFSGELELLEASAELCYSLEVVGLTTEATAAHIHTGEAGTAGGVVVTLTPPTDGPVEECVEVDASTANGLVQDPSGFYVNVHSADHPDGAVRGQLQEG